MIILKPKYIKILRPQSSFFEVFFLIPIRKVLFCKVFYHFETNSLNQNALKQGVYLLSLKV